MPVWKYLPINMRGGSNMQRSSAWSQQFSLNQYGISDPVSGKYAIYPYAGYKKVLTFDIPSTFTGRAGGAISGDVFDFYVVGNILFRVDSTMTVLNVGTLQTSTGPVDMVLINNWLSLVDGAYQYNYNLSTGIFTQNLSPNTPLNPTYITEQQSQTLMNSHGTQQLFQSATGNPQTWNPLNVLLINYESSYLSYPLIAFESINGRVFCFTTKFIEVLQNAGKVGFSFLPDENLIFGYGAMNATCLARGTGGSQGQQQPQFLIFICQNPDGTMKVMMTTGNPPIAISTPSVEQRLNKMINPQDCVAFVWTENGQTFWQASFNTDNQTIVYSLTSEEWFDIDSLGNRHIAEAFTYSVSSGTKYFISNIDNCLYEFSEKYFTLDGIAPRRIFVTSNFRINGYKWIQGCEVILWAQQGVGIAGGYNPNNPNYTPGTTPSVTLSVSYDGGVTYFQSDESESLGTAGLLEYDTSFKNLGSARQFTFKLEYQEPVPLYLLDMEFGFQKLESTN